MKDTPCIRVGHLKIVDHLILGIARYLQESRTPLTHTHLETYAMNSWEQVCDALTDGDINGAFMPAPMAMHLFSQGLDIKIIMFTHRCGSLVVKSKLPGINSITDFKGRTILVPSEFSIQNMLVHKLLSTVGLKFGSQDDPGCDVTREVANPFLMTEMMLNDSDGDIAGFAVAEPFGSDAVQKKIAEKVCTTAMMWKNHPCCVFVLHTSFIKDNSEAVSEIVSLFTQAGICLEKRKDDEILLSASNFLEREKKIIDQMLQKTLIRFDPDLLVPDTKALNIIQDYMTDEMGIFKNKIDINDLVDSSFILKDDTKKKTVKADSEN